MNTKRKLFLTSLILQTISTVLMFVPEIFIQEIWVYNGRGYGYSRSIAGHCNFFADDEVIITILASLAFIVSLAACILFLAAVIDKSEQSTVLNIITTAVSFILFVVVGIIYTSKTVKDTLTTYEFHAAFFIIAALMLANVVIAVMLKFKKMKEPKGTVVQQVSAADELK